MRHFDDMDIGAASDCHRGEFEADKAGADDDDLTRHVQSLPQYIGVGQGSEHHYAIELGAGNRQRPASGSGG
jgi:hypothetical protein